MNKAEIMIGEKCFENAKNKKAAQKYFDRYERMKRDKALDKQKEENRELKWN